MTDTLQPILSGPSPLNNPHVRQKKGLWVYGSGEGCTNSVIIDLLKEEADKVAWLTDRSVSVNAPS